MWRYMITGMNGKVSLDNCANIWDGELRIRMILKIKILLKIEDNYQNSREDSG